MTKLTFDDVLIEPRFSTIKSRSEVNLRVEIPGVGSFFPLISANMDTVTDVAMANALADFGAIGCLHRFWDIKDNRNAYKAVCDVEYDDMSGDPYYTQKPVAVSVGLGQHELDRAWTLYNAGARMIIIDVAHAAQMQVVEQYKAMKEKMPDAFIVVGNFASLSSLSEFIDHLGYTPDGIKIGIGPGSACTTRIKTGVGYPQLSAIQAIAKFIKTVYWEPNAHMGGEEINHSNCLIIADGGLKTPGDIAKALGAGADMVMVGGMLAGTEETPGKKEVVGCKRSETGFDGQEPVYTKKYRGSASKESYDAQGKDTSWRTAEGESFTVPYKGPVLDILKDIEGGLRSAFTYVGARNLKEFHEKVRFVEISSNGVKENGAHGKLTK